MDYEDAGVDISQEEKAIAALVKQIEDIQRKDGYNKINVENHFAGILDAGDFYIAMSTDGVGTKVIIANEMNYYEGIGKDLIAMNVNDIISTGAEPIAFVDYLTFEDPDPYVSEGIGRGLSKAAKESNINILGGETATLSEIVNGFDVAGTCIGVINSEENLTLGDSISTGDKIVGIKSSGIHSNGLTLARKSIKKAGYSYHDEFKKNKKIGEELLEPTRIYVKPVLEALNDCKINGLANITGGGLNNLKRLGEFGYHIQELIEPPQIFDFIQECGDVDKKEMYNVFNMGIGYAVITRETEKVIEICKSSGYEAKVIGEVRKGDYVEIDTVGKI
ncbi:MAG: Phosphoribosylaminoimidazole (AIR) synthetase PurM [Candidatus Methanohalarchaeum thermophilum]|uniref:Phosphoribosylformylglycinamidine cyclo-ligase n=1 Tax=Methanohalarchaeum thermophilum TaxID=1903181 RepID=A0A1Q6DUU5_METT1|nr:MAG: Phosphoribosylaminoimidazole (AIR) synthetase PurM [Candidatus Methanohalarchaeum thermophilum]